MFIMWLIILQCLFFTVHDIYFHKKQKEIYQKNKEKLKLKLFKLMKNIFV